MTLTLDLEHGDLDHGNLHQDDLDHGNLDHTDLDHGDLDPLSNVEGSVFVKK